MERVLSERMMRKETVLESLIRFPFFRITRRLFTFHSLHLSEYPGTHLNEAILISDGYNLTRHPHNIDGPRKA